MDRYIDFIIIFGGNMTNETKNIKFTKCMWELVETLDVQETLLMNVAIKSAHYDCMRNLFRAKCALITCAWWWWWGAWVFIIEHSRVFPQFSKFNIFHSFPRFLRFWAVCVWILYVSSTLYNMQGKFWCYHLSFRNQGLVLHFCIVYSLSRHMGLRIVSFSI